jgi:putative transposase
VVSPSARRRAEKMSVEEGIGKVAAACRALGLARSSSYRGGRVSLESRRIRSGSAGVEREASSLRISAH